jgi:hypothetical protein
MMKLIRIGVGVAAPHLGELSTDVSLGSHIADAERSSPTYHTSVDAVWAKDVPLGISSIHLNPWDS